VTKSSTTKRIVLSLTLSAAFAASAEAAQLTTDAGAPVGDNQNSQTAGPEGPVLFAGFTSS